MRREGRPGCRDRGAAGIACGVHSRTGLTDETVASSPSRLVALYRTNELPFHLKLALQNGVTKTELTELTHLAFYADWPTAATAVGPGRKAFEEEGV